MRKTATPKYGIWRLPHQPPGSFAKNGYWNLYYRNGAFYTFGFNYENLSENVGLLKLDSDKKLEIKRFVSRLVS